MMRGRLTLSIAVLLAVAFATAMFALGGTAVAQSPDNNPPEEAEQATEPPVEPPAETPAESQAEQPADPPAEQPPAEPPAEQTTEPQVEQPAEPAADQPAEPQTEQPTEELIVPETEPVEGVGNESEECVDLSCNSGNVADIDVNNNCQIFVVDAAGDVIINDVCNTVINVIQEQIFKVKKIIKIVKVAAPVAPAAVKGKLPKTGVPAPALGLMGSALTTAGVVLWKRRRRQRG